MTKTALIGHTGFVGSILKGLTDFNYLYNSKNIQDIHGKEIDLAICAGIPAAMWLANNEPEKDLAQIENLFEDLKKAKIKRLVLISTIAVYDNSSFPADENDHDKYEKSVAYGKNRRIAEKLAQKYFEVTNILRLPALFGPGLKKNLISDLMNLIPKFLNQQKYNELKSTDGSEIMKENYFLNEKSFWECKSDLTDKEALLNFFKENQFTSLNFTNPKSKYQFYNMLNLWNDINQVIDNKIEVLNICSPPLIANDISVEMKGLSIPQNNSNLFDYNMRSIHAKKWGNDEYLYSKESVISDLKEFLKEDK